MKNYYDDELQPLADQSVTPGWVKVQFTGDNVKTNWMNLNTDSIEAIRAFLDIVEENYNSFYNESETS